jgi:hypothetical protein
MGLRWLQSWGYSDFFVLTIRRSSSGSLAMFAAIRPRLVFREQPGCRFAGPTLPRNRRMRAQKRDPDEIRQGPGRVCRFSKRDEDRQRDDSKCQWQIKNEYFLRLLKFFLVARSTLLPAAAARRECGNKITGSLSEFENHLILGFCRLNPLRDWRLP